MAFCNWNSLEESDCINQVQSYLFYFMWWQVKKINIDQQKLTFTSVIRSPACHFHVGHQCPAWRENVPREMILCRTLWHLSKVLENAENADLKLRYCGFHTANFMEIRLGWGLIFCLRAWHVYLMKYGKFKMCCMSHFHVGHWCPAWAIFTWETGVPCGPFSCGTLVACMTWKWPTWADFMWATLSDVSEKFWRTLLS